MAPDSDKLHEFLALFAADPAAALAAGAVVIGRRLGLYHALAAQPAGIDQLAAWTHTRPGYLAAWLRGQAEAGHIEYDPATGCYSMSPEQARALATPGGACPPRGERDPLIIYLDPSSLVSPGDRLGVPRRRAERADPERRPARSDQGTRSARGGSG